MSAAGSRILPIDEAHLLTHGEFEAIRILTNAEMDAASSLACLLIGQPTLRRMLRLVVLPTVRLTRLAYW